jgi:hypothetical protein
MKRRELITLLGSARRRWRGRLPRARNPTEFDASEC